MEPGLKQKQINQGCNDNWVAWQMKTVGYLIRCKNNDDCVDKDANKFLLHQLKVWYILNERINYIFDLHISNPQEGLIFLKNIIPLGAIQ